MQHAARWLLASLMGLAVILPVPARAQSNPAAQEALPLLPGLEKTVAFWKKIFAEYSVSQLVFVDVTDMGTIFEVRDVGPEDRSAGVIDAERARVAAAYGVPIEHVKAQRGIRERTEAGIKRSGRFIGFMKKVFRERGLPEELAYLPLVESSYDSTARSSVGALGMWQFMRVTGRQYMRVNRDIDERLDPIESTRAAAAFLGQAYDLLGNWPLAITSYNFGPGGMARAVREVQSDNLIDLINNYSHPYWGYAPKNFYAEFLVAVEIGTNYRRYFPDLQPDNAASLREVTVSRNSSVAQLAAAAGLTVDQFLAWNPAVSRGARIVPAGYQMKLPENPQSEPVFQLVNRQSHDDSSSRKAKAKVVRHRVQRGETVAQIARRYGASAERILQANGIRRAHLLQVGALLLIPHK